MVCQSGLSPPSNAPWGLHIRSSGLVAKHLYLPSEPSCWPLLISNFYLFTLRDRVLCNPAGQEFCVAKDDFGLLTSPVLGNRHGSPCPVLTGFLGYCITTGSQEVCVGSHSCLSLLMKIEITMLLSSKCDVLRTILFPFWGGTVVPSQ